MQTTLLFITYSKWKILGWFLPADGEGGVWRDEAKFYD